MYCLNIENNRTIFVFSQMFHNLYLENNLMTKILGNMNIKQDGSFLVQICIEIDHGRRATMPDLKVRWNHSLVLAYNIAMRARYEAYDHLLSATIKACEEKK